MCEKVLIKMSAPSCCNSPIRHSPSAMPLCSSIFSHSGLASNFSRSSALMPSAGMLPSLIWSIKLSRILLTPGMITSRIARSTFSVLRTRTISNVTVLKSRFHVAVSVTEARISFNCGSMGRRRWRKSMIESAHNAVAAMRGRLSA